MKTNQNIRIWVIVNFILLLPVPLLFILGLLWSEHWREIFNFAGILIPILWLHLFYQGLFIGGAVAIITICILLWQRWSGKTISRLLLAEEICVILLGIFDVCPISVEKIGHLYYLIPGW